MREMKDSGLEWVGKIPADWEISKVGAFYEITLGKMLQTRQNPNDTLEEYLCAANVGNNQLTLTSVKKMWFSDDEKETYKLHKGDLLVVEGGDIASSAILDYEPNNLFFQNSLHRVTPKNGVNSFLRYWLISTKATGYFDMICNKATIAHFTKAKFIALPFAFPTISEQNRIVSYLDAQAARIDEALFLNRAQIEELRLYKQSLITETVTRGLDPDAPMKDSGVEWIGQIPAEWTVFPSKYMFHESAERRKPDDEQLTASQKYGIISQEEYMLRENARVVMADKGLENWKHVEPNDFVISLRSFQGGLEMSKVRGCVTWHYIVLRAGRELDFNYYKWLFKSKSYITALQRTCNYIRDGQDLRYSNFVAVPLCEPPLEEQKAIASFLDGKIAKIDALITLKQSKIEKLTRYRQSLIYEYVTGKKEAP